MTILPSQQDADFRYKDVEAALAETFQIRDDRMKAFRARIQHLRRLGLPDLPKVGSGTQIRYTIDHVRQLYLALEFAQMGIDPAKTVSAIERHWGPGILSADFSMISLAHEVGDYGDDFYLVMRPCFLEEVSVFRLFLSPESASEPEDKDKRGGIPTEDETEQFLRGESGVVSLQLVRHKDLIPSYFEDLRAGVSLCMINASKGLRTLGVSLQRRMTR